MDRDTPTFNLKAVVQETGIKPDTLRAWERRYGLPEPERSMGGHRLYSQRDMDILLWLMARQEEGLTISRAVDLWRSIEAEGRDPLRAPEYTVGSIKIPPVQGEELVVLCKRWIDACLAFDERTAERVLAQAFAMYPVETVCTNILQKGLHEIGEEWYKGTVSVQQEHFAAALAMRRMDALLGASSPPTRTGRILMACPPGEEHVFGQALLQFFLRRRGWETVYLGANVPVDRLETSIDIIRPHLVVLAAQRLQTAATLLEIAEMLRHKNVPVAYGGQIFIVHPLLRQRIPGHYLGDTLASALQRVEEMIPVPPPLPEPEAVNADYRKALSHFQSRHFEVSAAVSQEMLAHHMPPTQLAEANANMTQNIVAALKLGDIDLLNSEIDWIKGLLANRKISGDTMAHFLQVYAQATQQNLGHNVEPVANWLATARHRFHGKPSSDPSSSHAHVHNGHQP